MNTKRHTIEPTDVDAVDITKNECLFPTLTNRIISEVKITPNIINKYSSTYNVEGLITRHINISEFVFCNNGSECILKQIIEVLSTISTQWVIPTPTFELTPFFCEYYKCNIESPQYIFNDKFSLDIDTIRNTCDKILYMVSPHNPTAIQLTSHDIHHLCSIYKFVIIDQAYISPIDPIEVRQKNLIYVRSFSKMGLITGMRFGYGICFDESLYAAFNQIRPMYINAVTLAYVEYIITNNICDLVEQEIAKSYDNLPSVVKRNTICRCGNFVLLKNIESIRGNKLKQYNFDSHAFFRLTLHE